MMVIPRGVTEEVVVGCSESRGMAENKERDGGLPKIVRPTTGDSRLAPSWDWEQKEQTYDLIQRELFRE